MPQTQGAPPLDSPGPARSAIEDDPADLLQRIQGAIPDLQSLLHRYKETSGQLSDKESKLQATEAQKSETIRNRETQINQLSKELDEVKNKHHAECSKLRLELGNVEEKHKELQENLILEQKFKEDVQASLQTSAMHMEEMQQKWESERATLEREFAAKEKKMLDEYTAKQKVLEENNNHQSRHTEATLQAQLDEKDKLHLQEISTFQAGELRRKRSLVNRHDNELQGLRDIIGRDKKERDESRVRHADSSNKEREVLKLQWSQERISLDQGFEEERQKLVKQYREERDRMQDEHALSLVRQKKESDYEKSELQRVIKRLEARWDDETTRNAQLSKSLKESVTSLNEENSRLKKIADAFGEVTDLRSRGDPF